MSIDGLAMVGEHVSVGGLVGDRFVPCFEGRIDLGEELHGDGPVVEPSPIDMQGAPADLVPTVAQRHVDPSQPCRNPHRCPSVGERPLPRVALTLRSIDLLEREEPPRDVEFAPATHVPDPHGRLVGVGADRIEEELDRVDPHGASVTLCWPTRRRGLGCRRGSAFRRGDRWYVERDGAPSPLRAFPIRR